MESLGFLLDRLQQKPSAAGRLPSTDFVAGLSKKDRRGTKEIENYFREHFSRAMGMRRTHAINWIKVLSILNGIHHFHVDPYGNYTPLAPHDKNHIRVRLPVLKPLYRWEHGRLTSNQIGVTSSAVTGRGRNAFYDASLAQDTMTAWIEETDIAAVEDDANQSLITYGGYAYHVERDPARQQVFLRHFPMCDLLPIPFDARNWDEMYGVARVTMVSESWLQMQDELYEIRNGKKPDRPMAKFSGQTTAEPNSNFVAFSTGTEWFSRWSGARVAWVWMKPSPTNGYMGEHLFFVEDELYGYVSGRDERGRSIVCPRGILPLYPVQYLKKPNDWWPDGFCEEIVPLQREMNRQFEDLLRASRLNRGLVAYNQNAISANDIQGSVSGLVPFNPPGPEDTSRNILEYVAPNSLGREMASMLQLVDSFTKQAASYQSGIIMGQAEGRTESGPAVNTLNANAQAPMVPILDRKWRALKKSYADVLDGVRAVWPVEKKIVVLGAQGVGREVLVRRDELPGAEDIALSPTPLVINGKMGMLNLLMSLRQMQTEDGPLVSTRELRRSLQLLNLAPPGIEIFDKREQRILYRIGQLINDGQTPLIPPAGDPNDPATQVQQIEDHAAVVAILKEFMLEPSFAMYSRQVQAVLKKEMEFHQNGGANIHRSVDSADDAAARWDALQGENMLEAFENDPTTLSGQFAPGGIPVG